MAWIVSKTVGYLMFGQNSGKNGLQICMIYSTVPFYPFFQYKVIEEL